MAKSLLDQTLDAIAQERAQARADAPQGCTRVRRVLWHDDLGGVYWVTEWTCSDGSTVWTGFPTRGR